MTFYRLATLLLLPATAHAADEAGALAGTIAQMTVGLGLVLALLFGALWLIKKLSLPRGAAASSLRVLAAAAVGPRERVVLVEIADKVLVLGVAPGRVSALHTLDAAELPLDPAPAESPAAGGDFAARLARLLEKRR